MERVRPETQADGTDALAPERSWRERALAHWVPGAIVASAVGSPGLYFLLAADWPALALFLVSLATLAFFVLATVAVWPTGTHITLSRTMEIWGYRAAAGATAYIVVGYVLMLVVNTTTARTIPTEFPLAIRYLPFWPFYVYLVIGCGGIGPCPPVPT